VNGTCILLKAGVQIEQHARVLHRFQCNTRHAVEVEAKNGAESVIAIGVHLRTTPYNITVNITVTMFR